MISDDSFRAFNQSYLNGCLDRVMKKSVSMILAL
ncbi:MAG: hypothetical protein Nkreftii_001235 [Candidatus Nitrospira kreftii]|uniref:Uncharacterized protein n=1 Tax=Candidatus Nitrospira kreftii TaxID=2652173 RepID=A0A7S8FCU5_9BACT|nr:MAG: hypothetical protein Nkreftii_001235 [Candidatus Nitrospira kreftii]